MSFNDDKEAMAGLKMTDAEIGRLLDKTRQAVNVGLNKHPHYFDVHELKTILRHVQNRPGIDLSEFQDYLRNSRGDKADDILSASFIPALALGRSEDSEVWAVLPDYAYFVMECPSASRQILDLYLSNPGAFKLITTTDEDFVQFVVNVRLAARAAGKPDDTAQVEQSKRIDGIVNAYPYLLALKPNSLDGRKCYVLARGEFQEISDTRARQIIEILRPIAEQPANAPSKSPVTPRAPASSVLS